MSITTQNWQAVPQYDSGNKNAIFFAINNEYAFAVANVVMGLLKHSEALMRTTDIIIYHNGISEKNMELLRSLHENTLFIHMQFPQEWEELLAHPRTQPWGAYVICKLYGFELISKYEKVLHLDADMYVCGDISSLFEIEEEFAWRSVIGWKPNEVFASVLPAGAQIQCGNGGMLLFTNKLSKYGIDKDAVKAAFLKIKDLPTGGIDETVIAWIIYEMGIQTKDVDIRYFNTPSRFAGPETRLVHFLNSLAISSKPWVNPASYIYHKEWAQNYQKWLDMGGEGPVHFSKEDYYQLFGYEKEEKVRKLKKKVKKLVKENQEQKETLEECTKEKEVLQKTITDLRTKNEKINKEAEIHNADIKKRDERIRKLEKELSTIRNSKSWKLTKPLRIILKFFKKLIART